MVWENSQSTKKIFDFFNQKYGQVVAPVGVLKACSVVSAKLDYLPIKLNIFHITPSRQFKTRTSLEVKEIFPKGSCLELGSDFTIHSLYEQYYKTKNKLNKKCLLINDATMLMESKNKRTKIRLINSLSELLSEGVYRYGERQEQFEIKAKFSMIINMTLERFAYYETKLLETTFLERMMPVFYIMPEKDLENFYKEEEERIKIKPNFKIKFKPERIDLQKHITTITTFAKRWVGFSLRSFLGIGDQIKSLLCSHAVLNNRNEICQDDFDFLNLIEPYLINPTKSNAHRIITWTRLGYKPEDIRLMLNADKGYLRYIYKVIANAKLKGLLA